MELGDRDADDVRVSFFLRCCATDDRERARSIGRKYLAFLIGAYGPYYRKAVERQEYEAVARAVRTAWEEGR